MIIDSTAINFKQLLNSNQTFYPTFNKINNYMNK